MLRLLPCIAAFAATASAAPQWTEHELVQVRAALRQYLTVLINGHTHHIIFPNVSRTLTPALFSQGDWDMLVNVAFWRDICNKLDEKALFLKLKSKW